MFQRSRLAFALSVFLSFYCEAEPYVFSRISPGQYPSWIQKLHAGDEIEFSNGKIFRLGSTLGEGGTTRIFAVEGASEALRIPLRLHHQDFISHFIQGSESLEHYHVPKVAIRDSLAKEYVLVSRIQPTRGQRVLTLDDFFKTRRLQGEEQLLMADKLLDFAETLAPFDSVGDFKSEQVAWDPIEKNWKLIDWTHSHHIYGSTEAHGLNNVFRHLIDPEKPPLQWAQDLIRQAETRLQKARAQHGSYVGEENLNKHIEDMNFEFDFKSSPRRSQCVRDRLNRLFRQPW